MKPFYSLLLGLLLLLTAHPTRAQIVRVTNGQSLSALIASATAGITFIVEPGSYGDLTLTKRVAIIGPGYFLGNSQQATTGSATFGTITFNAGSENSILMSCAVNSYINIGANQVAVSRCLAGEIRIGYGQGQSNVSNITVKQCFVQGAITTYVGGTIDVNYSGCMIKNNIVFRNIDYNGTFQGNILYNTVIAVNDNYYGIVPNYGLHGSAYAVIKNNIANRIFTLPC